MESEVLSMYIKKLGHPIKEIRERSLKLLGAKLKLGWILEDELAGTRDLLNVLLSWFHKQQPSLQKEALELLLATVKTKSGSYIVKEMGTMNLLSTINTIKHKIASDAIDSYQELIETLTFLNSVQSEDDLSVPHLNISSITSCESEGGSSGGYYNVGYDSQTSKDATESSENNFCNEQDLVKITDGIRVVLFPWVDLCPSDSKTMLLIEDALKLFKSTRRCCRFIRDVYLRDFPPEIFLNRPSIIQYLLTISKENNSRRPEEALIVLLYITKALCKRIPQLTSLHLIHAELKFTEDNKESVDNVNLELEQMAGDDIALHREDSLIALKQLPAPIYALDTLHSILTIMFRNVVDDDTNNNCTLDLNEINLCINLVENLIQLLFDCVQEQFWTSEHPTKIHRDTAHKSCMVFRLLGDLTTKYRKEFFDNLDKNQYRVWWLRLIICSERLLRWARQSALPPATLTAALQAALLDPAVDLFYPLLSQKIADLLQNAKVCNDQEFKNKYKQLTDLVSKMEDAVIFMKNKNCCRNSKTVLMIIKNSLPVLELHLNEAYVNDIAEIILTKSKGLNFDDNDWDIARNIALHLMSHRIDWVQIKFYRMLADMVKAVIVGDNDDQIESEKCLNLLCDVGILSEICCHGLLSNFKEVEESASEVMVYLLRGRLALSESCWWKLLASLLPILPLLHVYAAHETQLGKAICKSLEAGIAERMGVCAAERAAGLTRLLFVRCVPVQFDAAHELTVHIDDDRYLPPKEILRADVLVNALRRVEPREFNVDYENSPSKSPQTTGLIQILEVLKQDIMLDENGVEFVPRASLQPTLDPSLRRSTLQQLAVVMRQPEVHDMFLQCDGLKVVVAILRMSLMVEDYLAFPECATSCVSILNSICFVSRHDLSKIPDLLALLIRVILVFPANEWCVSMCAQVLCVCAWAGFCLHELRAQHSRARPEPALPHCVVQRTSLPFHAHEYWTTSPNALHSSVEWLLGDEECRLSLRVRWWCAWAGTGRAAARGAPSPPAPLALRPAPRDAAALRSTCPTTAATQELMNLENATSHRQVVNALSLLENYVHLQRTSSISSEEFNSLPWHKMQRFLVTSPSSPRDIALMISLLQFIIMYMDNTNYDKNALSWILSNFITDDAFVITLLSKEQLYPQQSQQDCVEVTQLHIHIVKIILRCVLSLDKIKDYNTKDLESLVKILLVCLDRLDLKNFHMLGYLNELIRCIRYTLNIFICKLTEETLLDCMRILTRTLSGCASGGGRKGQACRLDALLALLALLKMTHDADIPVQRWSEYWSGSECKAVVRCGRSERAELRAAAVHALAALAHHAHCMPHLMQAIPCPSLSQYAVAMFTNRQEANAVRAAAAHLLTTVTSRTTPHCDVLEADVMEQFKENEFLQHCLEIFVDYCADRGEYIDYIDPNIPLSVMERRSQLEVRAKKSSVHVSPSQLTIHGRVPPTAELVAATADVVHNVVAFSHCPVQAWNDQGLFRIMFRCASNPRGSAARVSARRALVAASAHQCVRLTLAATNDCLYDLLLTLTPTNDDPKTSLEEHAQGLLLLACILAEKTASQFVWRTLKEKHAEPFFFLILQTLESDDTVLREAGQFCLTRLLHSISKNKYHEKDKFAAYVELFDNLPSPYASDVDDRLGAGDEGNCLPEYMAEEICKLLMFRLNKLVMDNKMLRKIPEDGWSALCSCLSSLWSMSGRGRLHGAHRGGPRALLAALRALRDHLSVHGKPVQVIRNADHNPTLCTLYWLLTVIDSSMLECQDAKESYVEEGIAISLNRLWPWCMMTEQLRYAVIHLLYTFCNNCPKAWGAMCVCVSGRSLAGELCVLLAREAALQSHARPPLLLLLAMQALTRILDHHHCRTTVIKSEALVVVYKLCVRSRSPPAPVCNACAGAWRAAARHAAGAGALLALRPPVALAPRALRAALMPALAHAAHHHRTTFLQSPELLELLSGTLLAGDIAETISAARAVWALAANHHKAKLVLRSAGVSASVQAALQRLRRAPHPAAAATERAVQLLTYTNTVLQTT